MIRLLSLLFLILPTSLFSCSCFFTETFCEYAEDYFEWSEGKTTIVRARFLDFHIEPTTTWSVPLYDYEILEVIAGEMTEERVSLFGQDGLNCNGPIIALEEGQEYILMFPTTDLTTGWSARYLEGLSNPYTVYDYPGCGPATLPITSGKVNGPITNDVNRVDLGKLRKQLAECLGDSLLNSGRPVFNIPSYAATVYPNPVADVLTVTFDEPAPVSRVSLYDVAGRLVVTDVPVGPTMTIYELNVAQLPPGAYLLVMETDGARVKKRVIVL